MNEKIKLKAIHEQLHARTCSLHEERHQALQAQFVGQCFYAVLT